MEPIVHQVQPWVYTFSTTTLDCPPGTKNISTSNEEHITAKIMIVATAVGVSCVLMLLITIAVVIGRMNG